MMQLISLLILKNIFNGDYSDVPKFSYTVIIQRASLYRFLTQRIGIPFSDCLETLNHMAQTASVNRYPCFFDEHTKRIECQPLTCSY